MAGGRKGHELSSARHPTISIYTRPWLSAHPREGEAGTAEAARWGAAETLGDRGRGGEREEERKRQTEWKLVCSERKKEEGGRKSPSGSLKEMCGKQTNTGGGERRRRLENPTALRDRVTNGKQLQRGEENKIW